MKNFKGLSEEQLYKKKHELEQEIRDLRVKVFNKKMDVININEELVEIFRKDIG